MQDNMGCVSATGSSKNKIKFLCSHGGKILPRPTDGHLKYVGGETRVISVTREIKFSELMKKLKDRVEGEMVLKYQLVPDDLDALVSVKSDEDIRNMFDENDRHETAGTARLRTFLFPASPIVMDNHVETPRGLEQKYIDALNGIVRYSSAPASMKHYTHFLNTTSHFAPGAIANGISSSACSSPRSSDGYLTDANPHEQPTSCQNNHQNHLHRIHSSPNISNLNLIPHQSIINPPSRGHLAHSYSPPGCRNHPQLHQGYHPSKPPVDPHITPERLISVRSVGRAEGLRYQMENHPPYNYYQCKLARGSSGLLSKSLNYDDYGSWPDRRQDRTGLSPLSMSPRGTSIAPKPWDTAIAQDG